MLIILVALTALLGYHNGLGRLDLMIGDLATQQARRAPSAQIVLIGIDEPSLASLGRWPWPRSTHAQLIDRLTQARPAAIGLDLLLSEPASTSSRDDDLLEQAMKRSGKVVLPVGMYASAGGGVQSLLPIPRFADSAAALGHVHFEIDLDGMVRSVFLQEGVGGQRWPQFALAMLKVSGQDIPPHQWPGIRSPDGAGNTSAEDDAIWHRDYWTQIPYAGPPDHFRTVSYVDVLEGRVPDEVFAGKLVMIGAKAAGMSDAYPTPVSAERASMPGVELLANVLDGLLQGRRLDLAASWQNSLFSVLPLLLALVALKWLSPRQSLLAVLLLITLTPLAAMASQLMWGLRFAPAAAEIGLLLSYPLWSWRRQEAAVRYMAEEFNRIRAEHQALNIVAPASGRGGDHLDRHIQSLRSAAEHLRTVHAFLLSSVNSLPDPVLVTDASGAITLSNLAALHRFAEGNESGFAGVNIDNLLDQLLPTQNLDLPKLSHTQGGQPFTCETPLDSGGDFLIKGVPRTDANGEFFGWIVSLVDIASVREAQRRRDEALRFISHDIRAPQSSILTLIELRRNNIGLEAAGAPGTSAGIDSTLERIEVLARQSLALADDFLQLARAESGDYVTDEVDLSDVVHEAVDMMWGLARANDMTVRTFLPDDPVLCVVERALVTRAVVNLIGNAVKFSPRGTAIECTVTQEPQWLCISVRDYGIGIESHEIPLLFQKFRRLNSTGRSQPDGAGLGLSFVKAVMTQHRGQVEVVSKIGEGTEFRLLLPYPPQV